MKRRRVLILISQYLPAFSGHAIYLHKLVPLLKQDGCEVEIVAGSQTSGPCRDEIDGIAVHRIPLNELGSRWGAFLFTCRLLMFLVRHRADYEIVHLTGFMDRYALLTLACKVLRKKVIMQMVLLGSDDPLSLKANFRFMTVRLRLMSLMDRFIFISRPIGESSLKAGLPKHKLRYIPQGVDLSRFSPVEEASKASLRGELGLAVDQWIVCFVGAVIPRKGVAELVEAWSEIQSRFPRAELVIVGPYAFDESDENQAALQSFVQKLQQSIESRSLNVRMVGRSDRVESFLQASDVFILLSQKEGFGNVIVEAMACGIPVVVTPMDGVAFDTVQHGVTGFIVGNQAEIVCATETLLRDADRRQEMGIKAREVAERQFQLERVARMYSDVYEELV